MYILNLFIFLMTASSLAAHFSEEDAIIQLQRIHHKLCLTHGSFLEEYPEQVMSVMFVLPTDKILEIGGNAGRNSCVISSLLNQSDHLVVSESDPNAIPILMANRDRNGFSFHIEDSAISQVSLVQAGWVTFPSEIVPPGHFKIKTISYNDLKKKYGILFNALVADCEGALYYILRDDESILEEIDMIIVENDYLQLKHYETVREQFIAHGFQPVYSKAGGWGPCYNVFYQVWQKPSRLMNH